MLPDKGATSNLQDQIERRASTQLPKGAQAVPGPQAEDERVLCESGTHIHGACTHTVCRLILDVSLLPLTHSYPVEIGTLTPIPESSGNLTPHLSTLTYIKGQIQNPNILFQIKQDFGE